MKYVLVCGGRDYFDKDRLYAVLDRVHAKIKIDLIIHGAQVGADLLAEEWARDRKVFFHRVPARWRQFGESAGPRRNRLMLKLKPHLVVAFPGGDGTNDMTTIADEAGISVLHVPPWRIPGRLVDDWLEEQGSNLQRPD